MAQLYHIDQLLTGCIARDRKMQEQLYRQTASKMLAICMRYAKDRMEAEDMLQLGYIKIFQKIDTYKGEGSFEGWMRKIMVHTAIESYRKSLRSLRVVSIDEVIEQPSAAFDFSSLAMKDLLTLIQKLSPGYRIVFNMSVIEGYSHREIAEALNITEGASKSQLSRARGILRAQILQLEGIDYASYTG